MSCFAQTSILTKKRLFVGLMTGSFAVVCLLFGLIWKISYLGLQELNVHLPLAFGLTLGMVAALLAVGIFCMVAGILGWYVPVFLQKQTYGLMNMLFYGALGIGKLLGIDRRQIEGSFVAVSNQIIRNRHIKIAPDKLLVVTPHCLQLATCPHKITRNPGNCKRCGGCDIGALVTMAEEMGFHFFVVTGGTLARQTVMKIRPQAVVAIACERDLASGIQDVYPIPSVGVLNVRPNGPCYNTHVDLEEFRRAVEEIIILPDTPKKNSSEKKEK
ncbi:MAG: DUF116 domain-containing protein [Anaerovibrio sp.]|nr:DUF116 domain-containing protein [Anaerovibrio sp.]